MENIVLENLLRNITRNPQVTSRNIVENNNVQVNGDFLLKLSIEIYKSIGRNHPTDIYIKSFECQLIKNNIIFEKNKIIPMKFNDNVIGYNTFDFFIPSANVIINLYSIKKNEKLVEKIELLKNQIKNANISEAYIINFEKFISTLNNNYTPKEYLLKPQHHTHLHNLNCSLSSHDHHLHIY